MRTFKRTETNSNTIAPFGGSKGALKLILITATTSCYNSDYTRNPRRIDSTTACLAQQLGPHHRDAVFLLTAAASIVDFRAATVALAFASAAARCSQPVPRRCFSARSSASSQRMPLTAAVTVAAVFSSSVTKPAQCTCEIMHRSINTCCNRRGGRPVILC